MGKRLVILALALALPVLASAAGHAGRDPEQMEQRIQQAIDRLELSADQQAHLKPIVQEHVAQVKAIRTRYPAEPTREQKREMFGEMRALRDGYDTRVRAVLTEEQAKKWEEMRHEGRERMRHEMKHRRDEAQAPAQPPR